MAKVTKTYLKRRIDTLLSVLDAQNIDLSLREARLSRRAVLDDIDKCLSQVAGRYLATSPTAKFVVPALTGPKRFQRSVK